MGQGSIGGGEAFAQGQFHSGPGQEVGVQLAHLQEGRTDLQAKRDAVLRQALEVHHHRGDPHLRADRLEVEARFAPERQRLLDQNLGDTAPKGGFQRGLGSQGPGAPEKLRVRGIHLGGCLAVRRQRGAEGGVESKRVPVGNEDPIVATEAVVLDKW